MSTQPLSAEQQRERLEAVSRQLRNAGRDDLAGEIEPVLAALRRPVDRDLISTGQAAQLLGVRSVNTIKRWVREGLLEGYRMGGRVKVTRTSVLRMASSPALAAQQSFDRELETAVALLGPDEGEEPEEWPGRMPWE